MAELEEASVTAEIRLREIEAGYRAAQKQASEKRHQWRALMRGAWTRGDNYEKFVIASISYAAAADQEAQLAEAFEEAMVEAQAEQLRLERERQPELGGLAS